MAKSGRKRKQRRRARKVEANSVMSHFNAHNSAGQGMSVGNDPHPSRSDSKMLGRAIRQRWPIPDESKAELIERQIEIANNGDARRATAAFRALLAADRMNQIDEQSSVEPTVQRHLIVNASQARLAAIAKELGFEDLIEATGMLSIEQTMHKEFDAQTTEQIIERG